jgi:hypothetical protein
MKKKHTDKRSTGPAVELDVETIADLEVDDGDTDLVKGGMTKMCPKNDGGSGTILVA